jgi:hypothetical protein
MRPFEASPSRPLIGAIIGLTAVVFLAVAPLMPAAALRDAPGARALTVPETVEALAALPPRSSAGAGSDA